MKKQSRVTPYLRQHKSLKQYLAGFALLALTCSAFAGDVNTNEKNRNLNDPRVPSQYLPIEKSNAGDSTSYTFIDRTTVKPHPYNSLIKSYTRVINYDPALSFQEQGQDNKTVSYRSMVIQEYVNCDKKEYAKGLIQTYEHDFGEGELRNTDDKPKRWETTISDTKERQNLIVICSLPVND